MSEINQITVSEWVGRLKTEGLLNRNGVDVDGATDVHLEGFVRAWADANELSERERSRLMHLTHDISRLMNAYVLKHGNAIYGESILWKLIHGLYGTRLHSVVMVRPRQRRILIESDDLYQAEALSLLVTKTLRSPTASERMAQPWSNLLTEVELAEPKKPSISARAYDRSNEPSILRLTQPEAVAPESIHAFMCEYPRRHEYGLGQTPILLTSSRRGVFTNAQSSYRSFIGTHGMIEVPSLDSRISAGVPITQIILAALTQLDLPMMDASQLKNLAASVLGNRWSEGRRSLSALLMMLSGRDLLTTNRPSELNEALSDFFHVTSTDADASTVEVEQVLVDAFTQGMNLPQTLSSLERSAYVYAAKVARLRRPGLTLRMQDVADILGIPRQTASRKWHAFQLSQSELFDEVQTQ